MKNTVALAILLATFNAVAHEGCNNHSPEMATITIRMTTKQENGEDITTENMIKAIAVSQEQATELAAEHVTRKVDALKHSMLYDKVFMIGDVTYIIKTTEQTTVTRTIASEFDSETNDDTTSND